MNKNAKELIEKIALAPGTVGRAMAKRWVDPGSPRGSTPTSTGMTEKRLGQYDKALQRMTPSQRETAGDAHASHAVELVHREREANPSKFKGTMFEKKSSMKNIIDDLIKGAQHNTFGRPVSIQQGFDPSPIDLAKFAGQLQALGEQGYSVKQAAEYLGLTERQVQDIVATVR